MTLVDGKIAWGLVATGAGMLGAMAARRALEAGWRAVTHSDPPDDPADPRVTWGEAIAWTAATGAVVGVARMCAQRVAMGGLGRSRGAPR